MRLIYIPFIFLFVFSASAQKTNFYAKTDARKIIEGSYLQVEFVLENGRAGNFEPPAFKNFKLVSGPSRSTSTKIVNGYRTQSMSFGYGIQAIKAGHYEIKPATITANGKVLKTQAIPIEVVKASGNQVEPDKQVYITLEVSDSTVNTGQQILVSYKLHTVYDVQNLSLNKDLKYDGFFAEEIQLRRSNFKREIIEGIDYDTKIIYKTALFPQQTGTYKIEPLDLNVQIDPNPNNRRKRHSIFSNRRMITKRMLSNGITIQVSPLPEAPQSFSGAVGVYQMNANTQKRTITTDDALVINMAIRGNGDAKTVTAPNFDLPEGMEMYDPNTTADEVNLTQDGWIHDKTFEYLVVAKKPGQYNIKPSFTYFNSDSSRYMTIEKNLSVNIIQGTGTTQTKELDSSAQINDIYSSTNLKPRGQSIYNSFLHLLMLAGFLLGGIGIWLYSNHLKKSGKTDPDFIRKNQAYKIAVGRLEEAKVYLDKNEKSKFYEEITIALKKYITDKFDIPALHLKKPEFMSQIRNKNLTEDSINKLESLFDRSEIALYAPSSDTDMQDVYKNSVDLIADLEK